MLENGFDGRVEEKVRTAMAMTDRYEEEENEEITKERFKGLDTHCMTDSRRSRLPRSLKFDIC